MAFIGVVYFLLQEPTYEPEIINKAMMEDPSLDFHTIPNLLLFNKGSC